MWNEIVVLFLLYIGKFCDAKFVRSLKVPLVKPVGRMNLSFGAAALDMQHRINSLIPENSKNGLASALATTVVKIALQPFDTLKTVQQMDRGNPGLWETATVFVRERGVLGLWSGVGVSILGSAPSTALYFGVYNVVKVRLLKILPNKYKAIAVAVSAALANCVAALVRAPYEVLKSRMQLARHPSLFSALSYSLREEGLLGLFDGGKLTIQILRDVPYAVIIGVCYEMLQSIVSNYKNQQQHALVSGARFSPGLGAGAKSGTVAGKDMMGSKGKMNKGRTSQDALCGGIAGGVGTLLTTPMDVVKTRLMSGGDDFRYASVGNAVARIFKEDGVSVFFSGTSSRLLHKIPANGLFYLCYEAFRNMLGVGEEYH